MNFLAEGAACGEILSEGVRRGSVDEHAECERGLRGHGGGVPVLVELSLILVTETVRSCCVLVFRQ